MICDDAKIACSNANKYDCSPGSAVCGTCKDGFYDQDGLCFRGCEGSAKNPECYCASAVRDNVLPPPAPEQSQHQALSISSVGFETAFDLRTGSEATSSDPFDLMFQNPVGSIKFSYYANTKPHARLRWEADSQHQYNQGAEANQKVRVLVYKSFDDISMCDVEALDFSMYQNMQHTNLCYTTVIRVGSGDANDEFYKVAYVTESETEHKVYFRWRRLEKTNEPCSTLHCPAGLAWTAPAQTVLQALTKTRMMHLRQTLANSVLQGRNSPQLQQIAQSVRQASTKIKIPLQAWSANFVLLEQLSPQL